MRSKVHWIFGSEFHFALSSFLLHIDYSVAKLCLDYTHSQSEGEPPVRAAHCERVWPFSPGGLQHRWQSNMVFNVRCKPCQELQCLSISRSAKAPWTYTSPRAGDGEAGSGTPTVPKYPVMQTLGFVLLPIPFAGPILGTFAVLAANYWSVAKYQAYFLQKIGAPTTPYSTVVLKQVITTVQNSAWDFNLNSHQIGQEVLYAELAAHGAQGYSLSAVFDDPSEKGDFNPRTMKSPICLVMQKPKDPSLALPRSFMIVNCPIHVEIDMGCCTAPMVHSSMPHLNNVLQMMATNRYRLGGCFLPKGWEPAAIINMPACRQQCCSHEISNEVMVIFQAVNTTITPASVVQVNPTTAPATLPGTSQAGAPPPVNQHTHVQLEAPAVEMASVGNAAQHMDSIMCPYCQMRLQNPPGVQAVTCPGCGNVIMTPE
ncbi:hypothetical protein CYMTET_39013 [Cymbomonas tetramitiformis]|uniref:Zinc finger LSD1-type domain-containing protein n=1 Tax=Cymbomonas tetramitiformis TaxID=36881 RepID=A0AAE0CAX1_9CHLO|nr:hypothetical protein CYMTET_39013 [Cymbomonas tetramitiformis]